MTTITTITNIGTKFNGRDLSVSAKIDNMSMRWHLGLINLVDGELRFCPDATQTVCDAARAAVSEYMIDRRDRLIQQIENGRAQYA